MMILKIFQMLFDGFVQIPFFFLIGFFLRGTSYPTSLAIIFVAIFGHQLGLIHETYMLYGDKVDGGFKAAVNWILCLSPLVYTRLQEQVIDKIVDGVLFYKVISLI